MDKNILEYFTNKYNTNDINIIIRVNHGYFFTEYTIKEAIAEFEEELKWFFDMLPDNVRSYEKAFDLTKQLYNKHLVA